MFTYQLWFFFYKFVVSGDLIPKKGEIDATGGDHKDEPIFLKSPKELFLLYLGEES